MRRCVLTVVPAPVHLATCASPPCCSGIGSRTARLSLRHRGGVDCRRSFLLAGVSRGPFCWRRLTSRLRETIMHRTNFVGAALFAAGALIGAVPSQAQTTVGA